MQELRAWRDRLCAIAWLSVSHKAQATDAYAAEPAASTGVGLRVVPELGGLLPLYRHIQFGRDGTEFDYVEEGGQDVLFPFARLSVEVSGGRHTVVLLYQPLSLDTEVTLTRAVTVDGLTFPEQTPIDLKYGFPFYRASYLYRVTDSGAFTAELGGSLQIRDATITFTSADGRLRRSDRSLGPVPALKARLRYDLPSRWFFAAEVDGFYAPVKYFNGGDSDVEGAIIDASLRAGHVLSPNAEAFANVRWLGGGAEGTSEPDDFGDGYNQNWLQFLTVSVGVSFAVL